MREIDPDLSGRALTCAAIVSQYIAMKVIREIESGALIDPHLQERYCAWGAGSLTISYEEGSLLFALRAKNNQTPLKAYSRCLYLATGEFI